MEKIRVIQIGVGGFGLSWLAVLQQFKEIELVAVVDVSEENLKQAQGLLGGEKVAYFTSHLAAFSAVEAELAVIITPPQTHKSLAIDALAHGLNVFMEKPIAHTYKEATELMAEAKKYEQFVMISQNYRWRPEIETIRKAVLENSIGKVEYVEWHFRRATKFGGWRDQYDEILIEDMSIHHFDLMRHILGVEPLTVFAKSMKPSWSWFNGNATATAIMTFEHTLVHYFGSWVTRGQETSWNGEFKLVGEKGMLELVGDRPYVTDENGVREELELLSLAYEDRAYSIYELLQAIKEKRLPATDIRDNIKSFAIVGAAVESIQTGKEIKIHI